ncbi:MAG: hypothetical protein Q9170_001978 [Blastenia crenularia]
MKTESIAISGLQSSESTRRLEQVADLRVRGIGDHIDLPQIVVCGDQSAGKSSVLEGVTSLPFPRQDGICTRFATEIILQHSTGEPSIIASIIPCSSRPDPSKITLRSYSRQLKSFDELPQAISDASSLMGIRGFDKDQEGPAFAKDVLRIKVTGPVGLHLTVVDLPGLISVPNDEQTEGDVQTVQSMVDSYVANPRTIILAVVQASNDIANQGIIQKSRHFDKSGQRTVGVITKPDLINRGTEKRIALLARNLDTTKLKLGYFLVKNPSPTELAIGITPEQRQREERDFFQSSPWKEQGLSMDRVGILSLRSYLQILLDQHMERELPKVQEEVRTLMKKTEVAIRALGDERPTTGHLRMFLSRLAMRFYGLTTSALNGTYHETDSVFFSNHNRGGLSSRLRASVHLLNTEFSNKMRQNGQKRKVVEREMDDDSDAEESPTDGQLFVTESEMKSWVKEVYSSSRGKELPGNYNHVLLSELFFVQSSRWHQIAEDHMNTVYEVTVSFVKKALGHVIQDERILFDLLEITTASLQSNKKQAEEELNRLCHDEEQQPITYNHYYTDNVQKSRQDSTRQMIREAMNEAKREDWGGRFHISNTQVDAEKLLTSLQSRITVNMDSQACSEALAGLYAYYKVALKTFVDNTCRQVIERHLLRTLPGIFCPETVAALGDEDLERIAAERPSNVEKRKSLRDLHESLSDSLRELRR